MLTETDKADGLVETYDITLYENVEKVVTRPVQTEVVDANTGETVLTTQVDENGQAVMETVTVTESQPMNYKAYVVETQNNKKYTTDNGVEFDVYDYDVSC